MHGPTDLLYEKGWAYHHHVVSRVVCVERAIMRGRWWIGNFDRVSVRELLDQSRLPRFGEPEKCYTLLHLLAHRAKD